MLAHGLVSACGGGSSSATTPSGAAATLGNIDARPFAPKSVLARRRSDDPHKLDIVAFERQVSAGQCSDLLSGLADMERMLVIQMPWPAPTGSVWDTRPVDGPQHAGVAFHVRRGLGAASQPALGVVRVESASSSGGALFLDVATANVADGVHGTIRGSVAFELCAP